MARHRRHDAVVFDLDATGTPTPHDAGPRRAQRLREAVAAGAVVLVAVAAWGVTTGVQEHQRVTRLLGAPGGVLSLAHAPVARWSAGTDAADATAFMPGLVVVRRGTVLHGLDAVTGADRWQVEVGGDPVCTTSAWGSGTVAMVVDPLVCWSGPAGTASSVTVIHSDGSSSTRALDGQVDGAAGTADGGLVTVRRIGPTPPDPQVALTLMDGGGYTISGSIGQGQDAVVRLEDAATGAVRWERTVPFRPVPDVSTCASLTVRRTGNDGPTVDVTSLSFTLYPSLVQLHTCGLDAGFTLSGAATTSTSGSSSGVPYVDGGVLEEMSGPDGTVVSVLHASDGSVVGTYPAQVLQPRATDGTPSDLVLAGSGGVPLRGFARDGSLRWQSTHLYTEVLVRSPGVVVAQRDDLAISGLDPGTGKALWTDDALLSGDSAGSARDVVQDAFTDGSVALLAVAHSASSTTDLVALDLATGQVRWRSAADGFWPQLSAVGGRLVEVVGNAGSVSEADAHGATIRRNVGTVTSLG